MLSTTMLLVLAPLLTSGRQDGRARCEALLALAQENPRLELALGTHRASGTPFVQGRFTVPEDRSSAEGRRIRLGLVVLPALSDEPADDPVFVLHGGPGAPATSLFRAQVRGWLRQERDVVLVDQRGTGSSNPLTVPLAGSDDDLSSYFTSYFEVERYEAALEDLLQRADPRQYTTDNAVDDFDELRAALGYERVNLRGGSYGTRAALVWMRRHPHSIRTATLQGVAPIAFRNPLPHAREAQQALELLFDEIRAEPRYVEAFGDLERKFAETLERLSEEPAKVSVRHPATGTPETVLLDRDAFAEAVRLQMYTLEGNRQLPRRLLRAHAGELSELAEASLQMSRSVRGLISWGTLISVTESEDLWRIDPEEIEAACAGTFLGERRVREQLAVAKIWPSGQVSASWAEPVSVDVPTLLWSGSHDPATSPRWGEEAARHLPRSLHVVVPGGHGVFGPAVERLDRAFLESGTTEGLDLSEVEALELPPLALP